MNFYFIKKNLLISETGDRHQKFASEKKVPLTGGIFLFLSFLFFINDQVLSFILFSFLILLLGIFSDLKHIKSASNRFLIQISLGALVSGLDAGQIYQSWPLMNSSYFPDDSDIKTLFSISTFESPSVIQFVHRNIAYLIFIFYLFVLFIILRNKEFIYLKNTAFLIFISFLFQIFLGILTILSGAQIILASLHQIGSILLVTTSLVLVFKNSKLN